MATEETDPVLPTDKAPNILYPNINSEETEPALPMKKIPDEPPQDQIVAVIGETGRWQLEKILIVFLVSIPGLAHIFVSAFVAPKRDFWCIDDLPLKNISPDEVPENLKVCISSCKKSYPTSLSKIFRMNVH